MKLGDRAHICLVKSSPVTAYYVYSVSQKPLLETLLTIAYPDK